MVLKFTKIIRLTPVFIMFFFLTTATAQVNLDSPVNFTAENISISDALLRLGEECKVNIAFSEQFFTKNKKINIRKKDTSLNELMSLILKDTQVSYKFQNGQLKLLDNQSSRPFLKKGCPSGLSHWIL